MNSPQTKIEAIFLAMNQMVEDADEIIGKTRKIREKVNLILQTPLADEDLAIVNEECDLNLPAGSTAKDLLDAVVLRKADSGDAEAIAAVKQFGLEDRK